MSQNIGLDVFTGLLEKLPGVFWALRMDATTGKNDWLYLGPRVSELYGVTHDEVRANPNALMRNLFPEDRVVLEGGIAESGQSLTPLHWVGRANIGGETRWLETHTSVERDGDSLLWWGQAQDVTERKRTEHALAEAEARRAESEALYKQVIDSLPVGVIVATGLNDITIMNPRLQQLLGGVVTPEDGDQLRAYGIFKEDGKTPLPRDNSGLSRALGGELHEEEVVVRNPRIANDVRIHATWMPLRDASGHAFAGLGTALDVTTQRQLEAELRARNEQLAASEEEKVALIARLRRAVDDLSNPILEVWDGVLAMPIIGVVDSQRTADMVQRLLAEVLRMQASFVIIDLTGVDIVDTMTADHLIKLMKKVEIVGAKCVLTGLRPAVADTLVDLGVDFGRLATLRNLKHGLGEALRLARRERETWRDYEDDERPEESRTPGRAGKRP